MTGTILNAGAIAVGASVGALIKTKAFERYQKIVAEAIGLFMILTGIEMALKVQPSVLVVICGLILGALIGEKIDVDKRIDQVGLLLTKRLGSEDNAVADAFKTASLLFCVGAMAVVGSIQDGLGDPSMLYVKSVMDGAFSFILAASLGYGVVFSAASVLIYQGTITVLATVLIQFCDDKVIANLTVVSAVLILGLAVNILNLKKLQMANMLPAIPVVVLLSLVVLRMGF